jgi:WD40 repeat protein
VIWNANSGEAERELEGHGSYVYSVSWSPDGRRLASGSSDNTVILWDASSGEMERRLEGHSNEVFSVSWSPDGRRVASGGGDKTVIIWDANGSNMEAPSKQECCYASSVCYSPHGGRMAAYSGRVTFMSSVCFFPSRAHSVVLESAQRRCAAFGGGAFCIERTICAAAAS